MFPSLYSKLYDYLSMRWNQKLPHPRVSKLKVAPETLSVPCRAANPLVDRTAEFNHYKAARLDPQSHEDF